MLVCKSFCKPTIVGKITFTEGNVSLQKLLPFTPLGITFTEGNVSLQKLLPFTPLGEKLHLP